VYEEENTMEVNGVHQRSGYRHSSPVQQKKEIHTGLEVNVWVNYPFNYILCIYSNI